MSHWAIRPKVWRPNQRFDVRFRQTVLCWVYCAHETSFLWVYGYGTASLIMSWYGMTPHSINYRTWESRLFLLSDVWFFVVPGFDVIDWVASLNCYTSSWNACMWLVLSHVMWHTLNRTISLGGLVGQYVRGQYCNIALSHVIGPNHIAWHTLNCTISLRGLGGNIWEAILQLQQP